MDDQAGGDRFEFIVSPRHSLIDMRGHHLGVLTVYQDEWRERVEAYEKEKQEKLIKLYDQEIVHDLELLKRPWEKSRRPPSSGDDYVSYDKSTFFTKFLPEWPLDWLDQVRTEQSGFPLLQARTQKPQIFLLYRLSFWWKFIYGKQLLTACYIVCCQISGSR